MFRSLPQKHQPSLGYEQVGFCIRVFEACSAFTLVTACVLVKPPYVALCTEGFSCFVTSTTAPITTGWSESLPGGVRTHWKTVPLHGAPHRTSYYVGAATQDYRDVIYWAEYDAGERKVRDFNEPFAQT
jgi:hypothetical protein